MSPGYLRPQPSAEYIGVAVSTLWEWTKKRHDFPKPFKLSDNCTVFSVAELDEFVKKQPKLMTEQ